MRILFVSSSWPAAGGFGGQLRALQIGRALQHVGRVSLLVVGSDGADTDSMRRAEAEFDVLPPAVPRLSPNGTVLRKFRWAFDSTYLNVHGYVAHQADCDRIGTFASSFDLVWMLNSRTPNILQRWHWPRTHLDLDDVPSTCLRAISCSGATWAQRWKARVQQPLLRRRERLFERRFTTLSVCSEADRTYLGNGDCIHVIPNGFQRPAGPPLRRTDASQPRIGFIGLYSYAPNLQGVRWFIKECWPAIRQAIPNVRLRLIGKDTDGALKPTELQVDALGRLEEPADEISTWSAMIVPIRFGGGTRIKVADAFSRKCPVVSTRFGAFGYEVEDGTHLRQADDPQEFAAACIALIRDQTAAEAMAARAWDLFLNRWTWDAIAPKVWSAAEDCLRRSDGRVSS